MWPQEARERAQAVGIRVAVTLAFLEVIMLIVVEEGWEIFSW